MSEKEEPAIAEQANRSLTYAELIASLKARGYVKYQAPKFVSYEELWAKKVYVDGRLAYHIHVHVSHEFLVNGQSPQAIDVLYGVTVQFRLPGDKVFNVEYLSPFAFEEMEAFYADVYEKLDCTAYADR